MKKINVLIIVLCLVFTGCSKVSVSNDNDSNGTLKYVANGEDFIREGFVTKDGWSLLFEHVFITLSDVKAYQTNPPYDSKKGDISDYEVVSALEEDSYTVDLAAGNDDAEPILLDEVKVQEGFYNAVSWEIRKDKDGNSLIIEGTATKDNKSIPFYIAFDQQFKFVGGEYIGDERKGIVEKDEESEIEMTFHFDHLFGDGSLPEDDELNINAIGFAPFYNENESDIHIEAKDLANVFSEEELKHIDEILSTLGHVGEGHCYSEMID